ncbi:MAG: ABC transporter ATP-binding protein [Gaiellaceae bacterium]
MSDPLFEIRDLKVSFRTEGGLVRAVDGVSFTVNMGDVLGIVGESGSGKSVTMLSVMGLLNDPNASVEGEVIYKGRDLTGLSQKELRRLRGAEIAMIFQDPMTSLTPVYRIGWQIAEQIRTHQGLSSRDARKRAAELLDAVGIPNSEARAKDFPHQFSGGMRQRVMIAMALSCNPDLLIADEPTTALDVTVQAQILDLIKRLREDFGSAVILITHDMGVIAEVADRIVVMYAGRAVELGDKRAVLKDPQHPYTWGLLGSTVRLDRPKPKMLPTIPGTPPSLLHLPVGCNFAPRCAHRFEKCVEDPRLMDKLGNGHLDACHLSVEEKRTRRDTSLHPELRQSA